MNEIKSLPILRLEAENVVFSLHRFDYVEGGGTPRSSQELGVEEHFIIKTLIFEDSERNPFVVLMHGDMNVDTKTLAAQLNLSKVWSCAPSRAEALSGWPVGATNPFALKTDMPIYLQQTVLDMRKMYVNGGGRGLLVSLAPQDFIRVVPVRLVHCAKQKPVIKSSNS